MYNVNQWKAKSQKNIMEGVKQEMKERGKKGLGCQKFMRSSRGTYHLPGASTSWLAAVLRGHAGVIHSRLCMRGKCLRVVTARLGDNLP